MSFNNYVSESDRPPKTLDKMKLQRFMLSLPSFDNQRLIFHSARQTLRKAEMARVAVREWLNQHDCELEEWKSKKASELGISISRLEQKLLAAAQHQAITSKGENNSNPDEDSA
ncbi:hypothetical protein [Nostoc edaphicum]